MTRTQLAANTNISANAQYNWPRVSRRSTGGFTPASSARPPRPPLGPRRCGDAGCRSDGLANTVPAGDQGFWFDLDASQGKTFAFYAYWYKMRSGRCNDGSATPGCAAIRAPPTTTATTSTPPARRRSRRTAGSAWRSTPRRTPSANPTASSPSGRTTRWSANTNPARHAALAARQLLQLGPVLRRRTGLRRLRLPLRRQRLAQARHAGRVLPGRHPARLRPGRAGDPVRRRGHRDVAHRLSRPVDGALLHRHAQHLESLAVAAVVEARPSGTSQGRAEGGGSPALTGAALRPGRVQGDDRKVEPASAQRRQENTSHHRARRRPTSRRPRMCWPGCRALADFSERPDEVRRSTASENIVHLELLANGVARRTDRGDDDDRDAASRGIGALLCANPSRPSSASSHRARSRQRGGPSATGSTHRGRSSRTRSRTPRLRGIPRRLLGWRSRRRRAESSRALLAPEAEASSEQNCLRS